MLFTIGCERLVDRTGIAVHHLIHSWLILPWLILS
jgi:hypothetical protein